MSVDPTTTFPAMVCWARQARKKRGSKGWVSVPYADVWAVLRGAMPAELNLYPWSRYERPEIEFDLSEARRVTGQRRLLVGFRGEAFYLGYRVLWQHELELVQRTPVDPPESMFIADRGEDPFLMGTDATRLIIDEAYGHFVATRLRSPHVVASGVAPPLWTDYSYICVDGRVHRVDLSVARGGAPPEVVPAHRRSFSANPSQLSLSLSLPLLQTSVTSIHLRPFSNRFHLRPAFTKQRRRLRSPPNNLRSPRCSIISGPLLRQNNDGYRYSLESKHTWLNILTAMNVRWPRLLSPTYLSQVIRNQKNPLKALQIFTEAKSRYPNYHHNGPVYATMINVLGSSGRLTDMKEVINQMKQESCECRDMVFASAIKTYANAGLLNEAVSLFSNLPQFNCVNWTESFNTLLQILVKQSKFEIAHRLFLEHCDRWEVKSRTRCLNLLIGVICQHKRSDLALHVFQEMSSQCLYPDRDTYRVLMKGLCDEWRINEAIHLLYSMFWRISQKGSGEDVVVYRILLEALCDYGHVEEAVDILDKVLRKGLKAPKRSRKQLDLSQCWDGKDKEQTKVLINEALIKGVIPSSESYCAMAVDLYSNGKISSANKVLEEMIDRGFRPPLPLYEAKIAALCSERRVDEVADVITGEMVQANCVPTVRLYNILIKGLCEERKSAIAVGYLEKITKQVGCVPNKDTYAVIVDGLCWDGKYIEASQILEQMLVNSYRPCAETYETLIMGLCLIGRSYEAIVWLEEMVSQEKMPQLSVWDSLVTSVCSGMVAPEVFFERTRNLS